MFVRALFDYHPENDDLLPCHEAGMPFRKGDILHILNQKDPNWWQVGRRKKSFLELHRNFMEQAKSVFFISGKPEKDLFVLTVELSKNLDCSILNFFIFATKRQIEAKLRCMPTNVLSSQEPLQLPIPSVFLATCCFKRMTHDQGSSKENIMLTVSFYPESFFKFSNVLSLCHL